MPKPKKKKIWTSKQAHIKFSLWIRERDGQKCLFCGRTTNLTNSHFWNRDISATTYNPDNCITLCWMPCHVRHEKRKNGYYRDFMISRLGKEKYDELEKLARSTMSRREAILACMKLCGNNLNISN